MRNLDNTGEHTGNDNRRQQARHTRDAIPSTSPEHALHNFGGVRKGRGKVRREGERRQRTRINDVITAAVGARNTTTERRTKKRKGARIGGLSAQLLPFSFVLDTHAVGATLLLDSLNFVARGRA
jgi:hypothetical protein